MRRNKLTENLPLKIVSVVIGFLVWLIVINVDNPTETRTFTIQGDSVELLNTAYIDSYNKMCIQDKTTEAVKVSVSAERKLLRRLTAADISVAADLQQAVSLDTSPVMIPMSATCTGIAATNIKVSPQYLSVRLEDKVSQEFVVNASYGTSKPGKGYEVGTQTVNPEKVKITGPKSLMNKLDKVTATVNINGKTSDVTEECTLSITDKNQDVLPEGRMAYLTIDNGGVATVTTRFWRIQQGISFFAAYTGEPAHGYQVESVTTVPDSISLAGTEEALERLRTEDNTLWLSGEELNIGGKSEDIEEKINILDFLPEDTKLTSGTSEDVYVSIEILPQDSHTYSIASGDVRIQNLAQGLQVGFEADSVTFRVKANSNVDIDSFDVSSVKAAVDLTGEEVGTYEVPVDIWLPKGYTLLDDVYTGVTVSEISNLEENPE